MKKNGYHFIYIMVGIVCLTFGFTYLSDSNRAKELNSKIATEQLAFNESEKNNVMESASFSAEAFDKMMSVLTHKRCMNCHPSGNRPRQGDDSHIHYFNVQRGEDNHGTEALKCNTCHHEENNQLSGVPGAPHWGLAPPSMGWEGLNKVEVANALIDPEKNGNRTLEDIVKHMTEDKLVLWAFDPGINAEGVARELPPISKDEFVAAVKEWAENGALIPPQ